MCYITIPIIHTTHAHAHIGSVHLHVNIPDCTPVKPIAMVVDHVHVHSVHVHHVHIAIDITVSMSMVVAHAVQHVWVCLRVHAGRQYIVRVHVHSAILHHPLLVHHIFVLSTHQVFLLVFQFLLKHDIVSGCSVFRFDFCYVFESLVTFVDLHRMVHPYIK